MSDNSGQTITRASPSTGRGSSSMVVAEDGSVESLSIAGASAANRSEALAASSHNPSTARRA